MFLEKRLIFLQSLIFLMSILKYGINAIMKNGTLPYVCIRITIQNLQNKRYKVFLHHSFYFQDKWFLVTLILKKYYQCFLGAYSEPYKTSKMERFAKIVHG